MRLKNIGMAYEKLYRNTLNEVYILSNETVKSNLHGITLTTLSKRQAYDTSCVVYIYHVYRK